MDSVVGHVKGRQGVVVTFLSPVMPVDGCTTTDAGWVVGSNPTPSLQEDEIRKWDEWGQIL